MRRWLLPVLVGIAAGGALLAAAGALALRGGVSARPEPSALEAAVARRVRHLAIPDAALAAENPVRPGDEALRQARAHFADHCASCHGNDGKGQTALGRAVYPRAPDLTGEATQRLSDGELFFLIENGVRFTAMPEFGSAGRPEESWKLVLLIRHLPRLTDAERLEMERLNPRSPAEWRELQEEDEFLGAPQEPPPGHGH